MSICRLVGMVFSGAGVARQSLEPLMADIRRVSGLRELLPETLNVRLGHPYRLHPDPDLTFWAHEWNHPEDVFLQRCRIFALDALIMRTSTNYHGDSVLEIMAEQRLRATFGLDDGSQVEVEVHEEQPNEGMHPAAQKRGGG